MEPNMQSDVRSAPPNKRSAEIKMDGRRLLCSLSFVKDGQELLSGGDEKMIRRWQVDCDGDHTLGEPIAAGDEITAVVLSPDRKWLVCALNCFTSNVRVWDAHTHKMVLDIDGHTGSVRSADISSDSTKFATGGIDKCACIWSMPTGKRLAGLLKHEDVVVSVRFSPDNSRLATTDSKSIRIFNTDDGQQLLVIPFSCRSLWVASPIAWSADGLRLYAISYNDVKCLDTSLGALLDTWSVPGDKRFSPSSIALSNNQKFVATIVGKSLSFWDLSTREQIGPVIENPSKLRSIALSPNNDYVAVGDGNGTITLRSLREVIPESYTSMDPQFPLMNIDGLVFKPLIRGDLACTEQNLTDEIQKPIDDPRHARLLAHRALVRSRSSQFDLATTDAVQSLAIQSTVIGHIAKAASLVGGKDQETVMQVFDLVFRDCPPDEENWKFLLLIKAIVLFISGNHAIAISRVHDLITTANDNVKYCYLQVLGNMYLKQGDYVHAIDWLERAKDIAPRDSSSFLLTISLMFGWCFDGIEFTARRCLCESLFSAGCILETVEALIVMIDIMDKNGQADDMLDEWVSDFRQTCAARLVARGDEALDTKEYDDAISHYNTALSLDPQHRLDHLMKRIKAQVQKKLWTEVLEDANEVIELDPLYPWGYEAKHAAHLSLQQYDEAINAYSDMLSAIEKSPDEKTRSLLKEYITPTQTVSAIEKIIREFFMLCPLVLIDTKTGCLCNGSKRMKIFKSEDAFKELLASMTLRVDEERIRWEVVKYFQYVTLSHVWQGDEPSFQDVNSAKSIQGLDPSDLSDKLRNFSRVAREDGFRWAWSDTCCIDKTISTVLNESLTLMYKWYGESAATLIYLASVDSPSSLGDLTKSIWMTRAWTLQELLAPKVVRFYDRNWKLYLNDQRANHKESPEIMGELAKAIRVPLETITNFRPDSIGIREKLRLASTRNATREEDVAYSLIGIFKSDIKPNYGDREKALGQLLEEIVARSGDVTALNWTGKSSPYNTCLPASLSVFAQPPLPSHIIEDAQVESRISALRGSSSLTDAKLVDIYDRINNLPPARFANRRLYLPCVAFTFKTLQLQSNSCGEENHYRARVLGVGDSMEFRTSDKLSWTQHRKFVLVDPWIRNLRRPLDGLDWESGSDEGESDSETDFVPKTTRALWLIARLQQPFHALLLQKQPNGEFKRVATEHEIIVPGINGGINDIQTGVLEIL